MTQAPHNSPRPLATLEAKSAPSQQIDTVSEIRDILFGKMMTEYERRFTMLEENLAMGIQRLQSSLEGQISDTLQQLQLERESRQHEHQSLVEKLKTHADDMQSEQHQFTKKMATDILEVKDDLDEYNRSIEQKIAQGQGDLSTYLRELADKLDNGQ